MCFSDQALQCRDAGWNPVPVDGKQLAVAGYSGHNGKPVTEQDLDDWFYSFLYHNIALVMPAGVIGIDVDEYGDKHGAATMEARRAEWGPLPPTWMTTSRSGLHSGISFFRVPPGTVLEGKVGHAVETVQWFHRYAMVSPSVHPTTGRPYRWVTPEGKQAHRVPTPAELPELPGAWLAGLSREPSQPARDGVGGGDGASLLAGLAPGEPDARVERALGRAVAGLSGEHGSRYDSVRDDVARLLRAGEQGAVGVGAALATLRHLYVATVGPDRPDAGDEFDRHLKSGAELIAGDEFDRHLKSGAELIAADLSAGVEDDAALAQDAEDLKHAVDKLRINDMAKSLFAEEKASAHFYALPRETLGQALERPRDVVPHRIEGLHKVGYNSTISAKFKTGKTTLGVNLLRSLVDGEPFLGRFYVLPPVGRVALLNYELDEGDMLDWLTEAGIRKTDRIALLNLRGRRFSFASDHSCAEFVGWCREMGVEVLDLDPHRLAMSGFGSENDNDDVNRFTERLDQIKVDAGVSDLFLKVHMGRTQHEEGAEHARGATSLDDWADQRWVMTKAGDGERFLYAEGRLAEVPEFKLTHDPATRLLVAEDGSRREAKAEASDAATDLLARVVEMLVGEKPGMNVTELKEQLKDGHGVTNNSAGSKAVKRAEELGLIRRIKDGRSDRLHPATTSNSLVKAVVL